MAWQRLIVWNMSGNYTLLYYIGVCCSELQMTSLSPKGLNNDINGYIYGCCKDTFGTVGTHMDTVGAHMGTVGTHLVAVGTHMGTVGAHLDTVETHLGTVGIYLCQIERLVSGHSAHGVDSTSEGINLLVRVAHKYLCLLLT